MIRQPTAAIVEREHPPRTVTVAGERRGQLVEVGGGAGETRQAHDRQAGRRAVAMLAHMEPQTVLRGHEMVGKAAVVHARRLFRNHALS
jgi:hypothetical protein